MSSTRSSTGVGTLAKGLALALLAGAWTRDEMRARAQQCFGVERDVRIDHLVKLALRCFREPPVGRDEELAHLLGRSRVLRGEPTRGRGAAPKLRVAQWLIPEPSMAQPRIACTVHGLPPIATEAALISFLRIMPEDLDWFADLRNLQSDQNVADALRHYRSTWLRKRSGSYRLIEAPKQRLKRIQRLILDQILNKIPLHDACHGHRRDRNVRSFVASHVAKDVVIRLDLEEFFSSIRRARIGAMFSALGYPQRVADRLAGLCCVATPRDVLVAQPKPSDPTTKELTALFTQRKTLTSPHLPQGAPSSPALANLAAYRLDARLTGLAHSYGGTYSRYADDLAFSGAARLARSAWDLVAIVGRIVREEGFGVRFEKTRIMTPARRQLLCGVVVNQAPTIQRAELERLEATLFNCVRHGPMTQNRENHPDFQDHLRGRIAWVAHLHPKKGGELQELFERIIWPLRVVGG